jgi:hypothetical protein
MSGAAAQARRRSEGTNGNALANQEETAVNDDGWCVSLEVTEEEIIDCLRSHTCYGGMESKKNLLRKLVEQRPQLLARLKTHCSHLEQSFDINMPTKVSDVARLTVTDVVKKLFQANVVLDQCLETELMQTRLVLAMESLLDEINKMRKEAHDTLKQKKKEDSLQNQTIKLSLVHLAEGGT